MSSESKEMRTFCYACRQFLSEAGEECPDGPCPKCGNDTRVSYPPGQEFRIVAGGFSLTSKPPRGGRWVSKGIEKYSHYRATGEHHFIQRTIDRISNRYYERIINTETGEVVRCVDEPLTDHQGRGSAKHK
jgi:hypothetical protein